MARFLIRNLPACSDWKGNTYPARVELTLVCSRGFCWDGGEFATRDEAVAAGNARGLA